MRKINRRKIQTHEYVVASNKLISDKWLMSNKLTDIETRFYTDIVDRYNNRHRFNPYKSALLLCPHTNVKYNNYLMFFVHLFITSVPIYILSFSVFFVVDMSMLTKLFISIPVSIVLLSSLFGKIYFDEKVQTEIRRLNLEKMKPKTKKQLRKEKLGVVYG